MRVGRREDPRAEYRQKRAQRQIEESDLIQYCKLLTPDWSATSFISSRSYLHTSSAILVKLLTPMHANLVFLSPSVIILFAQRHSISLSGILAGCAIYFVVCYLQSPWRKLPPGPRGLPILGNVLQLRSKQLLNFMRWKQEFGPKVANSSSLSLMIVLPRRHFLPQCSWTAHCRHQ